MKKILILIAILTFVSCDSKNGEQAAAIADTPLVTVADITEDDVDAITAATWTNNQLIFNGVLVIPPQRHATITLFMDGVVKNTSLLSGAFLRKGVFATLENSEYIALQQSYLESYAQEEFLEAEYRRQEMLFGSEAASQKTYQQSRISFDEKLQRSCRRTTKPVRLRPCKNSCRRHHSAIRTALAHRRLCGKRAGKHREIRCCRRACLRHYRQEHGAVEIDYLRKRHRQNKSVR